MSHVWCVSETYTSRAQRDGFDPDRSIDQYVFDATPTFASLLEKREYHGQQYRIIMHHNVIPRAPRVIQSSVTVLHTTTRAIAGINDDQRRCIAKACDDIDSTPIGRDQPITHSLLRGTYTLISAVLKINEHDKWMFE